MAGQVVVLIDRSHEPVSAARLAQVSAALQTQVDRDFGMVWGARARVEPARGTSVPAGAWSISIVDDPSAGLGIRLDRDGTPHAEVRCGPEWTLAVSHVLLEMIADPRGDRLMEGPDITPQCHTRRVRYLVEVCDPCQVYDYAIDGVTVADFVTPDYFRADAALGTAFDFLRRLRQPLQVPRGCSLSWYDPEGQHWHERCPDGTIATGTAPVDPAGNPRAVRDRAFPERRDRHDVAAIRHAYLPNRRRSGRRTGGDQIDPSH